LNGLVKGRNTPYYQIMATMPDRIEPSVTPSTKALAEALHLAEELLRELELGEVSLARLALKASRLARLLNDFDMQKTMQFESSGYPCELGIVPQAAWNLGIVAGRGYSELDKSVSPKKNQFIYVESIEALEAQVRGSEIVLSKITDTPKPANPS